MSRPGGSAARPEDAGQSPSGVSAIVLAGGRSSRFGSSKLDADLAGATVLDRTIDAIASVSSEIIVVGPWAPSRGPAAATASMVRFVQDRAPFAGPLAGVREGLAIAAHELAIVVGGDMPLVRADLVRSLLERLVSTDPADAAVPGVAAVPGAAAVHAEAAVLVENGEARPLPMALRRAPARQATEQAISAGERSLRHLLARLRAEAIDEAEWRRLDPDADSLVDIDTAADLDRARRRFAR